MADWSFTVIHYYDGGTQYLANSLVSPPTSDVISIPLFTDTGSGEVNEATLLLDAVDGQYIKDSINGRTEIKQYDRIQIFVNDGLGGGGTQGGAYAKFFYVMQKQPIKSKSEGVRLQLELLGTESFLQRIQYTKPHFFETPWNVFKDIAELYNGNRGSSSNMPTVSGHDSDTYNKLPKNILNIYDYGINEDTCFDRMSDVIDSMGSSASAGGVLNFFDLRFTYTNSGLTVTPNVFSSGNDPDNAGTSGGQTRITIDNSTSVNVGETDGGIDAKTGTQVLAWGSPDSGSLPIDFSKFYARQQFFNLGFPNWESGQYYQEGSKVSYDAEDGDGRLPYQAGSNTNTAVAPPGSGGTAWVLLTPANYYGNIHQYSPWTAGSSDFYGANNIWRNSAADPTASYGMDDSDGDNEPRPAFWDHNLVINDGFFWRTWVDARSTSDDVGSVFGAVDEHYLYDTTGNSNGDSFYRGFRILCDGTATGTSPFFGYTKNIDGDPADGDDVVDVNGKLIKNSVLQYDGTQWKVFARPYANQFTSNSDPVKLQVVNTQEARTYRFYKDESNQTWQDQSNDDMGNDSMHFVRKDGSNYKITNIPGVLADWAGNLEDPAVSVKDVNDSDGPYATSTGNGPPWGTENANSAVEVEFEYKPGAVASQDKITPLPDRDWNEFYAAGAWISLKFPIPYSSFNSGEDVGVYYGGGSNSDDPKEPTTIDTQNMHLTHDGKRGFNQTTSEDFGQINGIGFNMKLKYEQSANGTDFGKIFGGDGANFKMRCMLIDTDDNVVTQDFTMFFNDYWQAVILPINGFEIFKGREPRYAPSLFYHFVQPKGIDVQNIFVWRNLKAISLYTLDPYDEVGRYAPSIGRFCNGLDKRRRITLTLDALRFTKPLLASTGNISTDVIEPDFIEKPEIGNYEQLKSDAEAERQKHLFQRVEYDVTTTGRFDIGFGDYFNLADSETIPAFTDPTESAGSVKLVAKRIEYSISKPLNGKGGFLRRIRGVRRFT